MRRKLALCTAAVAAVAAFGPVSTASAVCIQWYYELTGDCSPCDEVDYATDRVLGLVGQHNHADCLQ